MSGFHYTEFSKTGSILLNEEEKSELFDYLDRLKAENEKLRELAKEACELARIFYDCGGTFNDLDDLLCEASELGIEVDV